MVPVGGGCGGGGGGGRRRLRHCTGDAGALGVHCARMLSRLRRQPACVPQFPPRTRLASRPRRTACLQAAERQQRPAQHFGCSGHGAGTGGWLTERLANRCASGLACVHAVAPKDYQ